MKYIVRFLLVVTVAVLVFLVAGVIATWAPDRPLEDLQSRWTLPSSQFLTINGQLVHLSDEGPRDDPEPLVLLHGMSASLHTWGDWAELLKKEHRVIRFDLPAFGLTGPNAERDYSVKTNVALVEGLVNALGVQRFAIGGNSLGGLIALESAAAMPHRVRRLILVDSAGYPLSPQSIPLGFKIATTPGLRRLAEAVLPRGVVESSLRNVYGDPGKVKPALVDRYYELALRVGNRQALGDRFDQLQSVDLEKLGNTIRGLKLATLILWGGKDRLIPVENGRRFAADIQGSQLIVFDDLGHVPQEEDAQRTVQFVRKFLNQP